MDDFSANASEAVQADVLRSVGEVARMDGIVKNGSRVLSNIGRDGHQEVPHLHMHIFGGKDLGRMIKPIDK